MAEPPDAETGIGGGTTTAGRFRLKGHAAKLIRAIIDDETRFNALRFEDDLDEANLTVTVELRYLRKTTEAGHRVLDELASACRHFDESDYRVDFANGVVVKGDDMKLKGKVNIIFQQNGLVDENDLYKQMHLWLHETLYGEGQ